MSEEFAVDRCAPEPGHLRRDVPLLICKGITSLGDYGRAVAEGVIRFPDMMNHGWFLVDSWAAYVARRTGMNPLSASIKINHAFIERLRDAETGRYRAEQTIKRTVAPLFDRGASATDIEVAAQDVAARRVTLTDAEVQDIIAEEYGWWRKRSGLVRTAFRRKRR